MNNLAETVIKLLINTQIDKNNRSAVMELRNFVLARILDVNAEIAFDFNEDPIKNKDQAIKCLAGEISKDAEFEKGIKLILQKHLIQDPQKNTLQINAPFANNQSISSQGNVVIANESSVRVGGIFANKIEAENVVSGLQAKNSTFTSEELLNISKGVLTNRISADEIRGKNIVSGIQLLNTEPKNVEELLGEVKKLREQIILLENQEGINKSQVVENLNKAESELSQNNPSGSKVLDSLEKTAKVLTVGADIAQAAGNLGSQIFKLATIASVLWKLATTLLPL